MQILWLAFVCIIVDGISYYTLINISINFYLKAYKSIATMLPTYKYMDSTNWTR